QPRRQGARTRRANAAGARRDGPGRDDGRRPSLPHRARMSDTPLKPIEIGLTAAIVASDGNEPQILTARGDDQLTGLPFGPFDAISHRTFEIGLRAWVEEQTGLRLGYVEQLYTFGDRGRHAREGDTEAHVASIGYLALTRIAANAVHAKGASFEPWYRFF